MPNGAFGQTAADHAKAAAAVDRLWSADNADRVQAKEEILELGGAAIEPLLALLNSMLDDVHTLHYARTDQHTKTRPNSAQAVREADELDFVLRPPGQKEMTWRLIEDTCNLLGKLKAEEAVPTLLRVSEIRPDHGLLHITSEMIAIQEIGRSAVPLVLNRFTEAAREEWLMSVKPDTTPLGKARGRELNKLERRLALTLEIVGDRAIVPELERVAEHSQAPDAAALAKTLIEKLRLRYN